MFNTLGNTDLVPFTDRREAGRLLARRLVAHGDRDPVVVGIAPDGVPVAAEIAHALHAALDTVAVEPVMLGNRDRFGTAAEGGIAFFDPAHRDQADGQPEMVDAVLIDTETRLQERSKRWHNGIPRPSLNGRTVLLVADILDDEQSAAAAACAVRDRGAAEVVCVAVQAQRAVALAVGEWMDEIVCFERPEGQIAASEVFVNCEPVSDEQIGSALTGIRIERERDRRLHRR